MKFRLGFRLGLGFGIIVLLLLALGGVAYLIFGSIQTRSTELSQHNLVAIKSSTGVERNAFECILGKEDFESDHSDALFNKISAFKTGLLSETTRLKELAARYHDAELDKKVDAAVAGLDLWWGYFQKNREMLVANNGLSKSMEERGQAVSKTVREFVDAKEKEYQQQQLREIAAASLQFSFLNALADRRGYRLFKSEKMTTDFRKSIAAAQKAAKDFLTTDPSDTQAKQIKSISDGIEKYNALFTQLLNVKEDAKQAEMDKEFAAVSDKIDVQIDALADDVREATTVVARCVFIGSRLDSTAYRIRLRHQLYQLSTTEEQDDKLWKEIQEQLKELNGILDELTPLLQSAEDKQRQEQVRQDAKIYTMAVTEWRKNRESLDLEILPKLTESSQQVIALARQAQEAAWHDADITDKEVSKSIDDAQAIIILALIVGVLAGIILAYVTARSITLPVTFITGFFRRAALGDVSMGEREQKNARKLDVRTDELGDLARAADGLRVYLDNKTEEARIIAGGDFTRAIAVASEMDGLGQAFQDMSSRLSQAIGTINVSVEHVASGAGQISSASQSLSQGATESAASLEEITSSMTEIGAQTKDNAERATQANQLAEAAKEAAGKGNREVADMVRAMHDIQDSGQKIAKIVKMIDDIAFQTNLLALNAAVEAARAGRHGKGFAVVAEEVRNLAGRSAKAAKETADLVESTVRNVESGAQIAGRTEATLQDIVGHAVKVADLLGEINAASNEQAQGISQVSIGLGQVDQVTQQNTANAEETASASQELFSEASNLRTLMSRFSISESGRANPAPVRQMESPVRPQLPGGPAAGAVPAPAGVITPQMQIKLDDSEFAKY